MDNRNRGKRLSDRAFYDRQRNAVFHFRADVQNRKQRFFSEKKSGWIDFDAYKMDEKALYKSIIAAINGETKCKSEDIREIAFYKKGVTL